MKCPKCEVEMTLRRTKFAIAGAIVNNTPYYFCSSEDCDEAKAADVEHLRRRYQYAWNHGIREVEYDD